MTKGGLPSEFIEEVKARNDIVDVVSKYITLQKRGGGFWACCPFHTEKTPSFSIKQEAQIYKCFGCGEGGNVITFVEKMENVDFLTAVEILAKSAGMEMPTSADSAEMQRKKKERDKIYEVLRATTDFYHNNLLTHPESEQFRYLTKRQISEDMIKKFQIGASLDYESLPKHLKSLGFKDEEMLLASVVGKNDNGLYDFYGKRLIFPICNGFGDVVAYSGRSVEDNPTRTKYKNTAQTAVFNKSEILFAYNHVREMKKQNMAVDTIVIVEGHVDVIACHQVGVTNVIGCMGTALTPLHAKRIKQLADNVILCLDGDSAGAAATYRAIDILKDADLNVKVVRLVGAKDPDEFIKKYGKDKFVEMLSNAKDCVDFVLQDSAKKSNLETNAEKTKYITESLNYISKFSTAAEQEVYLDEIQKLVKIPVEILRKSLISKVSTQNRRQTQEVVREPIADNYMLESKIVILAALLFKKQTNIKDVDFLFQSEDELKGLYDYLKEKLEKGEEYNPSSVFDNFDVASNSLIDRVINYNFPQDENVYNAFMQDTIKRVELYELKKEKERLTQLMVSCMTDAERFTYLLKIKDITEKIKEKQ
ncbi:MAG: DNA primase [Clostridia bacterium]|nr:DNA primase [Clostridia bacterium]